ncbi:MAG: cysteine--tRNA ligase [Planctomycetota bacterium]
MSAVQPAIRIYNSLSRKKEAFTPLEAGKVGLYGCGVTVYDECHLGHALQAIVFDVIYRYLQYRGFDVRYVRNYTDVDDKIIARANERGMNPLDLSQQMIDREREDMDGLGIQAPTDSPKVSEFIPQIVSFIQQLIDNGAAYATDKGNVYYRVRSKPDYGKLSGRKVDELMSGVRKDLEDDKEEALDFALWKSEEVDGAAWPSPWGQGRPGWHIECSVMSHEILGDRFDIHGGGLDLIFPHHENEIAQSESHCGHQHVNYWVHNGLLTVNKEKMSKSEGNFYTIGDALQKFGRELIRFTLLQYHYRSNPDFGPQLMATNSVRLAAVFEHLLKYRQLSATVRQAGGDPDGSVDDLEASLRKLVEQRTEELVSRFEKVMDDDFNAPEGMVVLIDGVKFLEELLRKKKTSDEHRCRAAGYVWQALQPLTNVFGVFQQQPEEYFAAIKAAYLNSADFDESWIVAKIAERAQARDEKNWELGDQIRDELLQQGVEVRDVPGGESQWMVSKDALERLYS